MDIYFATRQEWRNWLAENHAKSDGIWLRYYKPKSGKPRIKYADAVEEALCFGWIDSKLKKINDDYYIQNFTPRRRNSTWSKLNLERARMLTESGLMMPAGAREYEKALSDPSLINDYKSQGEPDIPQDLMNQLELNQKAMANFMNFSVPARRMYILWLNDAKRPETREKRIMKIVEFSGQNKRPGMM